MRHVALDTPIREGAAPQAAAEILSVDHPLAASVPRPAVLVIEDERVLRTSLERGLSRRGFAVWAAADGGEAVDLYRLHGERIDVVLSDLNMPVMDGTQALDALREINPLVRFCFMTGDTRQATHADLIRRGAMRVFTKPFPSVAEVAEELLELAIRRPSPGLPREGAESVGEEQEAKPTECGAGGGFLGWVVSVLTRLT